MTDRLRRWRLWPRAVADGFSMLEIVVAIAILGVAMAAIGPQMVASIQASGTAKLVSQAKGVLQGQLDAMRTLPFRVAPTAGDHRDLLDTYYRNLAAPTAAPSCAAISTTAPVATWSGYVAANNAARCSYEPAAGAFYRKVTAPGTNDLDPGFAVVLDTSFVAPTTTPTVLTPVAGYDSQLSGKDRPPSSQVGVTATVLYADHGTWKPITVYTQISSRTPSETRIKLDARATAVEIGSERTTREAITLTGGQLELNGSLSTTSQARASLSALASSSSTPSRKEGAALSVQAPYTNIANLNASVGELETGCSGPCWDPTLIPPFVLSADNGLPRAGVTSLPSVLNPVQTQLPLVAVRDGFRFKAATPNLPGLGSTLVALDPTPTVGSLLTNVLSGINNCAFSITGAVSHLTGSGYLNSTDETTTANPLSAEACGGAHTDVIRVLPTTTAPDGLIRITAYSAAKCRVAGIAHTPTTAVNYRGEVEYWKWTPGVTLAGFELGQGHGQYVKAGLIVPGLASDPLASIPLNTPVSDTAQLGDYIESITGLTADRVVDSKVGHVAEVAIPALVAVQTKPMVTGTGNEGTAVSLAAGAASCRAEDNR